MCYRYYIELSPELRPIIENARSSSLAGKMVHNLGRPVIKEGEVKSTDIAPVIASNAKGKRAAFPMIWGFRQAEKENTKRSQPLINIRAETAEVNSAFTECWQRRRCIVPASYYYDWEHLRRPDGSQKAGDKYAIQPSGSTVTWLAGLYRIENGYPFYAILTRQPSGDLAKIHDRMPVILPENAIADWINPATPAVSVRNIDASALTEMIYEKV